MDVEIYKLNRDINLFYVNAESFPEGIADAYEKLHSIMQITDGRKYFGVSYPDKNGRITYKAAVEEAFPGEAEKYGFEVFVLEKGNYISTIITGYKDDIQSIKRAFDQLLKNPDIDPKGYCVEMYVNDNDVRCMVKLNL